MKWPFPGLRPHWEGKQLVLHSAVITVFLPEAQIGVWQLVLRIDLSSPISEAKDQKGWRQSVIFFGRPLLKKYQWECPQILRGNSFKLMMFEQHTAYRSGLKLRNHYCQMWFTQNRTTQHAFISTKYPHKKAARAWEEHIFQRTKRANPFCCGPLSVVSSCQRQAVH